ncbi:MAG: hypothetical protein WC155_06755, partial [Candidatus Cloacimonadales bacterium]
LCLIHQPLKTQKALKRRNAFNTNYFKCWLIMYFPSIPNSSLFTLNSSLSTLHSSLSTLHSQLFTLNSSLSTLPPKLFSFKSFS